MERNTIIEMKSISKVYRTEHVETYALRSLDLRVEQGEFVMVTGPSGSGKTTFLNIAGLLHKPTSGEFLFRGRNVSNLSDRESSSLRNEYLGFVFQGFNLIPTLTVYENVEVPLRYRRGMDSRQVKSRIEEALGLVGLSSRKNHYPAELSGGQQQRVAIARAISGDPALILADEPTGNLDTKMADAIMGVLREINQDGTTIVMVTHDRDLALRAKRNVHVVDGVATEYLKESSSTESRHVDL